MNSILTSTAIALALYSCQLHAVEPVSAELAPFIGAGETLLLLAKSDLNRDNHSDALIVIEKKGSVEQGRVRELRLLTRSKDGQLTLAKRGPTAILCTLCGGAFGDPFDGIIVNGSSFTIRHYGGSRDRWAIDTTFGYSRIDHTWQLTKVEQYSADTFDPSRQSQSTYLAGKQFGKIAIDEFHIGGDASWRPSK